MMRLTDLEADALIGYATHGLYLMAEGEEELEQYGVDDPDFGPTLLRHRTERAAARRALKKLRGGLR